MKIIDKSKIILKVTGGYLVGVLLLNIAKQFSQIDYNIAILSLLVVTGTAIWAVYSELE